MEGWNCHFLKEARFSCSEMGIKHTFFAAKTRKVVGKSSELCMQT